MSVVSDAEQDIKKKEASRKEKGPTEPSVGG